jgi:Trypsin
LNVGDLINVSEIREHEQYDDWELLNDIVILKVPQNLEYGPRVGPVNLPLPNHFVPPGYEVKFITFLKNF